MLFLFTGYPDNGSPTDVTGVRKNCNGSMSLVFPWKETVPGIEELPMEKFSLECRGNWNWFVRSACPRDRLVGCVGVKLCTGNEERKGGCFTSELLYSLECDSLMR